MGGFYFFFFFYIIYIHIYNGNTPIGAGVWVDVVSLAFREWLSHKNSVVHCMFWDDGKCSPGSSLRHTVANSAQVCAPIRLAKSFPFCVSSTVEIHVHNSG